MFGPSEFDQTRLDQFFPAATSGGGAPAGTFRYQSPAVRNFTAMSTAAAYRRLTDVAAQVRRLDPVQLTQTAVASLPRQIRLSRFRTARFDVPSRVYLLCSAPKSGLAKDNKIIQPEAAEFPRSGRIRCRKRLGGLLNYYYREATA